MKYKIQKIFYTIAFLLIFSIESLAGFAYITKNVEEYPRDESFIILTLTPMENAEKRYFNPFVEGFASCGFPALAFESLFQVNLGTGQIDAILAMGWEWANENYTSVRVHLRPGVTWSDGTSFTAEDVVFTVRMLKDHPNLAWSAAFLNVESVEAEDNLTVIFNLKKPDPRFPTQGPLINKGVMHFPIVPKHIWADKDPETYNGDPPVWTGPYTIVEATAERVVWKKRDNYWGGQPGPTYVIFQYVGSFEKMVAAMINNDGDLCQFVAMDVLKDMQAKNPYISVVRVLEPYSECLSINCIKYPLSLKEVRWAINYAINKTKIIKYVWKDAALVATAPWVATPRMVSSQFIDPSDYEKYKNELLTYDPQKAVAILKGLNFTRGSDGVWVTPNGTRLSFQILAESTTPELSELATVVMDDLNSIGFEVTKVVGLPGPMGDKFCRGLGDLYAFFFGYVGTDPLEHYAPYYKSVVPIGESCGFANIERWSNETFDILYEQLQEIPPESPEARSLYYQMYRIWMEELPSIPITQGWPDIFPINTKYWKGWPTEDNPYCAPVPWTNWINPLWVHLEPTEVSKTETAPPIPYGYLIVAVVIGLIVIALLLYYRKHRASLK